MVMESPYDPPSPTIYVPSKVIDANFMIIRIKPTPGIRDALAKMQTVFQHIVPAAPFDYKFVDQEYAKKFAAEERVGRLTGVFSLLAIFISCLGIFGMASFLAEQRFKEIAVKKSFGAPFPRFCSFFSKHFVFLAPSSPP